MNTISDLYPKVRKNVLKNRKIGLEVELEFKEFIGNINSNIWRTERDGSLRNYGYEFISKPIDYTKTELALLELKKGLKEELLIKDCLRTSIHVHVGIPDFTFKQAFVAASLYWYLENLILTYCSDMRKRNLFSMKIEDCEGVFQWFKEIKNRIDGYEISKNPWHLPSLYKYINVLKYSSCNICNLTELGTLEFRALEGTTDVEKITRWVNMLVHLVEFSRRFEKISDIVDYENFVGKRSFLVQSLSAPFVENLEKMSDPVLEAIDYSLIERNRSYVLMLSNIFDKERYKELVQKYKFPDEDEDEDIAIDKDYNEVIETYSDYINRET